MKLSRPLISLDVETTGKEVATARVVELGLVILRTDGTRAEVRWLLNPGCPIPAEATAVHGFTDEQVADAPGFVDVAPVVAGYLSDADLLGYNLRAYDLPVLRAEFDRAGVAWPCEGAHVVDPLVIFRERERHTLEAAVWRYCGREHEGAHGAVADAAATLDVLLAQLAEYPDLPHDLAALDLASGGRQPDWATACGRVRWNEAGDAVFAFGKESGRRLVDARGYAAWVAGKAEFPTDLRDLCRAASRGERPRMSTPQGAS